MNTIEQAREVATEVRCNSERVARHAAADTIDALLAELAALKSQEPVAWVLDGFSYPVQQVHGWGPNEGKVIDGQYPLYLAAGAQERKPLSDEHIYSITGVEDRDEMMHRMARNIARSIEAAHGIKEQPCS